ncbi:hypothetical protein [Phenylobacterium sp.]|uniref:hypothetical protein n=1 Tax=Phenylobacterium sp. TaxID=1871053 RepID=UPI0035B10F86
MTESISDQLLRQRIRNNIIDYLEMAASADEQRQFESAVPVACVPDEMINLWEDSVTATDWDWYSQPVFTPEENSAIRAFHKVWEQVADETPDPMPRSIEDLIGTEPWDRLAQAAQKALSAFTRRGRFSGDNEEPLEALEANRSAR